MKWTSLIAKNLSLYAKKSMVGLTPERKTVRVIYDSMINVRVHWEKWTVHGHAVGHAGLLEPSE
jgi:hypothetical protein